MPENKQKNMKPRPPIVVVMGHVDHGKTTLLDYIRKTNVAGKEAGGITQAVGAYEISHNNRKITFIDTPGHEAFSKMRSRGAEVADLAILVVAAEDGVKPQTKETIEILNETKTPFIVAINKIDKTGGNVEKVKNDLASAGVFLEGYGGQISFHGISAKTGEGISELLDLILLAADMENLSFDPGAPASGYILEVRRDPRRGSESVVIVKNGILKKGSDIYTQTASGKVKILEDFLGKAAQALEPSAPALIIGFEKLPQVGEVFSVKPIVVAQGAKPGTLLKPKIRQKSEKSTLSLILKASDAGSLEALDAVIKAVDTGDKTLEVINESVGDITDGDVKIAIATNSAIVGFKNIVDRAAKNLAETQEVKIITSDVIYDLVKAVEDFLATLGKPAILGELEVLAVFNQDKHDKQLVGGRVTSGVMRSKANIEILRGLETNSESKPEGFGKVLSLRDKKADINQAEEGREIGLIINSSVLINKGDKLVIRK